MCFAAFATIAKGARIYERSMLLGQPIFTTTPDLHPSRFRRLIEMVNAATRFSERGHRRQRRNARTLPAV